MTTKQFYISMAVFTALIIGAMFYFNSCNQKTYDDADLKKLIEEKIHKSDSLNKVAIDTLTAIAKRDTVHNNNIYNIFQNSDKKTKEIFGTLPDNKRISELKRLADSTNEANK